MIKDTMNNQPPDIFSRQKDALAWLHEHFGRAFPSAGKFSTDCRAGACLVQADKTTRLKDLKKYAQRIGFDRGAAKNSGQRAEEREVLEIEKLQLDVDKRKLENRKADRNWIARETVYEREGALVGQIMGEARYQIGRAVPALIHAAKGDTTRTPEIKKILEEALFESFRTLYASGEVDQTFLEEDDE